jgi:hypothetical protein
LSLIEFVGGGVPRQQEHLLRRPAPEHHRTSRGSGKKHVNTDVPTHPAASEAAPFAAILAMVMFVSHIMNKRVSYARDPDTTALKSR